MTTRRKSLRTKLSVNVADQNVAEKCPSTSNTRMGESTNRFLLLLHDHHDPSMQSSQPSSSAGSAQSPTSTKSPDYVYFERTTAGFSDDAVPKAKAAQLKLEHFYKIAVDAAIERNTR